MKHKKEFFFSYILLTFFALTPVVSFAALNGVKGLLGEIGGILNKIIPIVFGIALIYFFWGVGQFILHDAGNDKTREDGKKKIIWGVVALFVFISIYGILSLLGNLVGIPPNAGFPTP